MPFRVNLLAKRLLVKAFHVGQRFGFDLLPRHFYSEVPNISQLRSTETWRKRYSLTGVQGVDLDEQLEFVRQAVSPGMRDYLAAHDVHANAENANGAEGYAKVEAQMLFAFVAVHRPKRILQVGCGVSTSVCLAALEYGGHEAEITCIEPYPTQFLQDAAARNDVRLIKKKVQDVAVDVLDPLEAGDLLFIDSTHTLGPAGEVTRLITEFLPRLRPGVFVHFHDIFFPFDYSPRILTTALWFWHESPLLHAFLCMNPNFRICASLSMLHHDRQQEVVKTFANYDPMKMDEGLGGDGDFPSAIYLQSIDRGSP